jgi:hypothetical protein
VAGAAPLWAREQSTAAAAAAAAAGENGAAVRLSCPAVFGGGSGAGDRLRRLQAVEGPGGGRDWPGGGGSSDDVVPEVPPPPLPPRTPPLPPSVIHTLRPCLISLLRHFVDIYQHISPADACIPADVYIPASPPHATPCFHSLLHAQAREPVWLDRTRFLTPPPAQDIEVDEGGGGANSDFAGVRGGAEAELREFQMTLRRINRAISAAAHDRPLVLHGEVAALRAP